MKAIRQLALREKAFGLMETFNDDFYEVWPHGKTSTSSPFWMFQENLHYSKCFRRWLERSQGGNWVAAMKCWLWASEWKQGMSRDFARKPSHVSVNCTCAITFVQNKAAILGMGEFVKKSFTKAIKGNPDINCWKIRKHPYPMWLNGKHSNSGKQE